MSAAVTYTGPMGCPSFSGSFPVLSRVTSLIRLAPKPWGEPKAVALPCPLLVTALFYCSHSISRQLTGSCRFTCKLPPAAQDEL